MSPGDSAEGFTTERIHHGGHGGHGEEKLYGSYAGDCLSFQVFGLWFISRVKHGLNAGPLTSTHA